MDSLKLLILILFVFLVSSWFVYYNQNFYDRATLPEWVRTTVEPAVNYKPIVEGYEYNTVYYCNDCKGKTFGQCTQCASCLWVRGYDYKNGKFFAECRKGDEHGLWPVSRCNKDKSNKYKEPLWGYSRDPFYDNKYESMFA